MIFPKNEHLKVTMYANSLLGIWPFVFENNPTLNRLYKIYSNCIFTYFIIYALSALIKLFVLLNDEVMVFEDIAANLCITLLYSVTIMRVISFRTDKLKNMIRRVVILEEQVLNSNDDEIIKIYKSYAYQSQTSNKIFLCSISLVTLLYFIHPLYVEDTTKYYPSTNETVIIRALPLSCWFPFDEQKHYALTYSIQVLDGLIGASYVTYTDIFTFSLIIFPLGQIQILKHVLSNFQKYAVRVKERLGCGVEEASFVTFRECVLKHKEIIRYVNEYNSEMKNIMVLDFLQSSLQLASILLGLLMVEMTVLNVVYSGQFAFTMFIRLLVYYWYANEIMVHSSEISTALSNSRWYEETEKVQKLMVIMMLRCNKELCLEIGPFSVMTLRIFLGILKATYSYILFIYQFTRKT